MALLKIDPGIIIWTWITFLLVLAILGASAWKIIFPNHKRAGAEAALPGPASAR